jgi:hypothetical protein
MAVKPPAFRAVAVHDASQVAHDLEPDGAAQAAAGGFGFCFGRIHHDRLLKMKNSTGERRECDPFL